MTPAPDALTALVARHPPIRTQWLRMWLRKEQKRARFSLAQMHTIRHRAAAEMRDGRRAWKKPFHRWGEVRRRVRAVLAGEGG